MHGVGRGKGGDNIKALTKCYCIGGLDKKSFLEMATLLGEDLRLD